MSRTELFIQALHELETSNDPEPLMRLFAPEAEVQNLASESPSRGTAHVREFWQRYRSAFNTVQSRFTRRLETDACSVLEWIAEGALSSGTHIHYRGISVLEWQREQIANFRTYYDSAAFLSVTSRTGTSEHEPDTG